MQHESPSYQTLLVSRIPVIRQGAGFVTDPLWARDINANVAAVEGIRLVCPVQEGNAQGRALLDPQIKVTDNETLDRARLAKLIGDSDIVEVPGNFDWHRSALSRQALRLAQEHGKLSVVGISSNRARTTVMNAAGKPLKSRVRAWLQARSIEISQRHLVRASDAVRVVGPGLRALVEAHARAVNVEIASWIRAEDIRPPRSAQSDPVSVVIASRLEPMKGVAVGLEAAADLIDAGQALAVNVIGVGAEEARLRAFAARRKIVEQTAFAGQLAYPEPFFDALRRADYVLLTNLNDEQPRLIFDAIAQGAIPLCPRHRAYEELALDDRLLYRQGSADDLRDTLRRLIEMPEAERQVIRRGLVEIARSRTLETMHIQRRQWVMSLLADRETQGGAPSSARAEA